MNSQIIIDAVENSKKEKHSFSEFIFSILKDKIVEVYVGDSFEVVKFEQTESNYPAVFIGKLIAAYQECIVLECVYIDTQTKSVQNGNHLFIHEKSIKAIDLADNKGTLTDAFLTSKDLPAILKHIK